MRKRSRPTNFRLLARGYVTLASTRPLAKDMLLLAYKQPSSIILTPLRTLSYLHSPQSTPMDLERVGFLDCRSSGKELPKELSSIPSSMFPFWGQRCFSPCTPHESPTSCQMILRWDERAQIYVDELCEQVYPPSSSTKKPQALGDTEEHIAEGSADSARVHRPGDGTANERASMGSNERRGLEHLRVEPRSTLSRNNTMPHPQPPLPPSGSLARSSTLPNVHHHTLPTHATMPSMPHAQSSTSASVNPYRSDLVPRAYQTGAPPSIPRMEFAASLDDDQTMWYEEPVFAPGAGTAYRVPSYYHPSPQYSPPQYPPPQYIPLQYPGIGLEG
ncbi:hypothetical protein PLICRDRAFT_86102 [Plicaturopsis crispa FD-325 SS-3]|nr:hypothetical protein PLICRDRAFT_86102 [Plicaturopsis crispa FD-325 SS-3]